MSLITIDFETYYAKDYSLSKMTTEEYIRSAPFEVIGFAYRIDEGEPEWVTGSDEYIAKRLHALNLHEHKMLAHNTAFDAAILAWRYNIHPKFMYDTLSMARPIADVVKGGSLKHLAERFQLGAKGTEVVNALGKRKGDFSNGQLAAYGEYCKNDVVLTYNLFNVLKEHSTPQECYMIDMLLRMYTDPVINLNREKLATHLSSVRAKKAALMEQIGATANKDILMSNPQFAELLQMLGVCPPTKINAKGKETWAFSKQDNEFMELQEHEDPLVQALVAARLGVKSTLEETRTERFISVTYRGHLPILLNYYGAHTGRASGGDKLNLQNLTRGSMLREAMEAAFGHSVIACDSAQIEARMTAWLAGQEDLVVQFRNGEDVYSVFATDVYGYHVDKSKADERFVGKTAILGLGFGCGASKFHHMLKVKNVTTFDAADCERTVAIYRQKYAMIAKLWKEAQKALQAMARGDEYELGVGIKLRCTPEGIILPNGMIQRYPNLRWLEPDGEKIKQKGFYYDARYGTNYIYGPKLIENVVQALARIVVFNQMAKIDQNLKKYDRKKGFNKRFRTALTVHDEVVCICPDEYVPQVKDMMVRIMSTPPSWAPNLPIACEAGHGKNYGSAK